MNRQCKFSIGLCAGVLAAVFVCGGCRDKAGSQGGSVTRKKPTPEESFQLIFETFRRGIETGSNGVPGGFVAEAARGRSRLTVNNSVSKELIPPANAEEPYRAKIFVVSKSAYSLIRSDQDSDDDAKETEQSQSPGIDVANPIDPATGVNVLDPGLIGATKGATDDSEKDVTDPVARRDDKEERTYELVYQDGRWRLLTKLDEETERAVQNAFNAALKTQT